MQEQQSTHGAPWPSLIPSTTRHETCVLCSGRLDLSVSGVESVWLPTLMLLPRTARAHSRITRLLKRRLLRLADTITLPHYASGEQTHIDSLSTPTLLTTILLYPPTTQDSATASRIHTFPSPLTHLCDICQSEVAHSLVPLPLTKCIHSHTTAYLPSRSGASAMSIRLLSLHY
ncbi:hypothetical protein GGP41_005715 [Bipolaris sorokiniana]|uniref:Uncharacterized protein n=1 Tax=Cochliobolus sativus TaxID=45130 RepID=A0A8H6DUF0_COCSA|nr:hypothetical protein GGP41_005715 [Bipolaris sorokiniana]